MQEEEDDDGSSFFSSDDDDSSSDDDDDDDGELIKQQELRKRKIIAPDASLQTLQKAWQQPNEQDTPNPTNKLCAACGAENAKFRCSRCQAVWYCNPTCQRDYHPVHRKECIHAEKHYAYWGCFQQQQETDDGTLSAEQRRKALENALKARIKLRRVRALKQAAARQAVERARRRQQQQQAHVKGGKGKEATAREETCVICQCEFTVAGDGGAGLCCPASHYMCHECAGIFCQSVVGDLEVR